MNTVTLFLTIGLIGLVGFAIYKLFLAKKETKKSEVTFTVTNPVQENPNAPITKEPEFLFMYSGEVISRMGKTYKWDSLLKKYVELV